jgi:hypothetical protein
MAVQNRTRKRLRKQVDHVDMLFRDGVHLLAGVALAC